LGEQLYHLCGWSDFLVRDQSLMGLVKDWSELLASGNAEANEKIRMAVRTGRPLGDEGFAERIEGMTGRDLCKGTPGRPKKH